MGIVSISGAFDHIPWPWLIQPPVRLRPKEQQEANGTERVIHDDSKMEDRRASPSSSNDPVDFKIYEELHWKDLPVEIQDAAKILGYTEATWNDGEDVHMPLWEELGVEKRGAAETLGYDKTTWNFGIYDDMYWQELPNEIRNAYGVLGFDEDVWEKNEPVAAFDKDWDQLAAAARKAASMIGYTAKTWDGVPDEENERRKPSKAYIFFKGSSYVVLDCAALSGFWSVIQSIYLVGSKFLNDNSFYALQITLGLAAMQCNGQIQLWLNSKKDKKKARSRKKTTKTEETGISKSMLHTVSWWAIFSGVNHFYYAFEEAVVRGHADALYLKATGIAREAFEAENAGAVAGAANNMTCSYVQNLEYNNSVLGFLAGKFCEMPSETQWYTDAAGAVYCYYIFVTSALVLWFVFGDNFFKGCDI